MRPGPAAVLRNTDPALRAAWHPVARSTEVGGEEGRVRLLGEDWTVVRRPDGLAAFADRAPRQAEATTPSGLVERHGLVWLAPEEPRAPLVDVPELADPRFMVGELPVIHGRVGAGLMIDNFLDVAHFPFVHADTIGTEEAEEVGPLSIERVGFGLSIRSEQRFPNHEDPAVARGERPLLQHRIATYEYRAPFSIRLRLDYVEAGGSNVITFFVQPEDDDHCRVYSSVMRDDLDGDPARLQAALAFEQRILDEDLQLQQRYVSRSLPLDLTTEVHIKADRMTVELRRVLAELVATA